ncbi:DUF6520 family protein [Chryseobacterium sp. Marseille-Q8038]
MKNFRFLLAAAVVFAVGSAFTNAPENKSYDANWYLPTNPNLSYSDPGIANFSNYNPSTAHSSPSGCGGESKVCAAQFTDITKPANQVLPRD